MGIFGGGSTALLAQLASPTKLVALDIREARVAVLDAFIRDHDLGDVVSVYFGVDQADTARLAEIVQHEFNGAPLDLVVDDTSHLIDETRTSFNLLFPQLQPGGSYVIEDWSWPHRSFVSPDPAYTAVTPISAFVLELALVAACDAKRDLRSDAAARLGARSPRIGAARWRGIRRDGPSRRRRSADGQCARVDAYAFVTDRGSGEAQLGVARMRNCLPWSGQSIGVRR